VVDKITIEKAVTAAEKVQELVNPLADKASRPPAATPPAPTAAPSRARKKRTFIPPGQRPDVAGQQPPPADAGDDEDDSDKDKDKEP
jgi:hypothetical protein